MQYYLDITLLPDEEIGMHIIWGKLYQQLHLALVELNAGGSGNIGFSFPEYHSKQRRLGRKVRIFSLTQAQLVQLDAQKWLERLSDYCHISSIRPVPENTQYAIFSRKQCASNPQRLARRRAKRKGETLEQALMHFSNLEGEFSALPFVAMESLSTASTAQERHRFKLFIEQQRVALPQQGVFNCYGLSQTATVPWF